LPPSLGARPAQAADLPTTWRQIRNLNGTLAITTTVEDNGSLPCQSYHQRESSTVTFELTKAAYSSSSVLYYETSISHQSGEYHSTLTSSCSGAEVSRTENGSGSEIRTDRGDFGLRVDLANGTFQLSGEPMIIPTTWEYSTGNSGSDTQLVGIVPKDLKEFSLTPPPLNDSATWGLIANPGEKGQTTLTFSIDVVTTASLQVSVNRERACPNLAVTFTARNDEGDLVNTSWSGGGNPATGTGSQFTTRFPNHGQQTVTATTASGASATKTITVLEISSRAWTDRFPTSVDTADLAEPFRTNVDSFLRALRNAGLVDATGQANPPANSYRIGATRRPTERAYLMHYAWRIARQGLDPRRVPAREGVDICWTHRNANGTVNQRASERAAEEMVRAFGMRAMAALDSNHIRGEAIDVTIQWQGDLNITNGNGQQVLINTLPRSGGEGRRGEGNAQLREVGATFGVIKGVFRRNPDPPHWSVDGR
jgi:hypothetical protein